MVNCYTKMEINTLGSSKMVKNMERVYSILEQRKKYWMEFGRIIIFFRKRLKKIKILFDINITYTIFL